MDIINPSGGQFIVTGINWYGFEPPAKLRSGLEYHDYTYIVNEIN